MLLYSQAVEYYSGIGSNKYTYFESRIQNMLIRPEIFAVMSTASRNPKAYEKKQLADKKEKDAQPALTED